MVSGRRFWTLSLVGFAVITLLLGWAVNRYYVEQRIALSAERLLLLSVLRREAMQRYLDTAEAELRFWSANPQILAAQKYFRDRWQQTVAEGGDPAARLRALYIEQNPYPPGRRRDLNDLGDGSLYSALHADVHGMAKLFVTERGYYDFFLIDPGGNIAYSVEKEDDFGTNLLTGPWRDTGLGDVFRRALEGAGKDAAAFSDLEFYGPSADEPALFMGKATRAATGELLGVIAFQLPVDKITAIMHHRDGMGETGETYLVGNDFYMRSNSRFNSDSTILSILVDTRTVRKALRGEQGVEFTPDYRGVDVLSAFTSLPVGDTRWAVMAEIDRREILENATRDRPWLAGLMLLVYGLGAWSAWFVKRPEFETAALSGDFDGDGGMDMIEG